MSESNKDPWKRIAYIVTRGRGLYHTFDSVWTDRGEAEAYAAAFTDGQVEYCLPLEPQAGDGLQKEIDKSLRIPRSLGRAI